MPRSTARMIDQSTEPTCWHVLAFGDCCYSEGLVKSRGTPRQEWGQNLSGTTWKHQQSWRGHHVPRAFPRQQSQGLQGLNEPSRQVSVRSVTLTASLCLRRDGEGGLSPHGGCSQLVLCYSGRRVLITSDTSGTSSSVCFEGDWGGRCCELCLPVAKERFQLSVVCVWGACCCSCWRAKAGSAPCPAPGAVWLSPAVSPGRAASRQLLHAGSSLKVTLLPADVPGWAGHLCGSSAKPGK